MGIEVIGAKETLKELRQLDPEMRKQFQKDAKQIAQPIVSDAQNRYPSKFLTGMARMWSDRNVVKFPYDQGKARKGVQVKIDTSKRNSSVITIIQKDPAAAIIDMAGKKGGKNEQGARFISALTLHFGTPSRIMWPAAEANMGAVTDEMTKAISVVAGEIERRIVIA